VRTPPVLLAVLAGLFVALAISPVDRLTWALENAAFAAAVVFLVATRRRAPLSNAAYSLVFLFLALHEVGAHYTYSLVPYGDWCARIAGRAVELDRNHFDRFVHLCFGLLVAPALREFLRAFVALRGFAAFFLPLCVCIAWSALYELVEWSAALVFGGDASYAYVGAQGDPWDAQKDMALAAAGATLSLAFVTLVERVRATAAARAGTRPAPRPRRRWRALRGLRGTSP
jgi:putative membrane protein